MSKFLLWNGTNYIKKDTRKVDKYEKTTIKDNATEFTYREAKNLILQPKSSMKWISEFKVIDINGEIIDIHSPQKKLNVGDTNFEFDESIIDTISSEVDSIIGLAAWELNQLEGYLTILNSGLSYYDLAISDVRHAMLDKKPAAHIRTKIYGIQADLEAKRRDIKQTIRFIEVMIKAIAESWTISKLKLELTNTRYVGYRGRTKYYDIINEMFDK